MKKILFVTKSEVFGGIEKVLIDLVHILDRSKYEITVMTGETNAEIKSKLPGHVKYRSLFTKKFKGLDRILIYLPSKILHKIFINHSYDVEISFQEGYPTKIISGASLNTKKICWFHNDPYNYDFNLPFFRTFSALNQAFQKFDEIITVSKFIADGYRKYNGLKANVIYNPIDYNKIIALSNQTQDELDVNENIFRICYVGRLSEEKQVDVLVESVISLHQKHQKLELIIIGEGYKHKEIYEKIVSANAQEYIKLLGYKLNPYPYIRNSSLLVCCSRTESFGLVIAEALALGVPVVATKCGGPEEILEQGKYGLLVDNNQESIRLGIEEMMENRDLYMGYKKVNPNFFKKYDINRINSQIENLFEGA